MKQDVWIHNYSMTFFFASTLLGAFQNRTTFQCCKIMKQGDFRDDQSLSASRWDASK
jgi:hypothetical protein